MNNNIAIQFDGVGKQYRLGLVGTGSLQHDINRWWQTTVLRREDPYLKIGEINDRSTKGHSDYVWALKDINFKVEQGDVVGIIGKNGAGKSTLLKLLSHITAPSTGRIQYRGRIASLLEVGTGFHPEMTARQNIYMNGSIMGMTRHEITAKLDEIVDFAGIERYLDTPVKRFSSGMTVRLGFAVAAFLEPEILVVDEVLAVGDAEFQKKAIGKMKDVSSSGGRTVLFVSHNMAAVNNLCQKGIVLKNGMLDFQGTTEEAIAYYLEGSEIIRDSLIKDNIARIAQYLKINKITFNDTEFASSTLISGKNYVDVVVLGESSIDFQCDMLIHFKRHDEVVMATLAEGHYNGKLHDFKVGKFEYKVRILLPTLICRGEYKIDIFLHQPGICYYLEAPNCAIINIDGGMGGYGRTMNLVTDGFMGLETI